MAWQPVFGHHLCPLNTLPQLQPYYWYSIGCPLPLWPNIPVSSSSETHNITPPYKEYGSSILKVDRSSHGFGGSSWASQLLDSRYSSSDEACFLDSSTGHIEEKCVVNISATRVGPLTTHPTLLTRFSL